MGAELRTFAADEGSDGLSTMQTYCRNLFVRRMKGLNNPETITGERNL
jgi:hypothetical protein